MLIQFLVIASFCALSPFHSVAQSASGVSPTKQTSPAAASPRFEAAHADRNMLPPFPVQYGPTREGDRYVLYAVSMQFLISNAYNISENRVIGGPIWLGRNRYDIEAKIPAMASNADLPPMLKGILEDRFHIKVHEGSVPQPARLLSQEKGGSKLKVSDGKGEPECKTPSQGPNSWPMVTLDCHNETMEDLVKTLQDAAGWRDKRPFVDKTGLKGSFDFKLSWIPDGPRVMTGTETMLLATAVSTELGLRIDNGTAPMDGLIIDSVDEDPTPDPPDTAKIMPPRPLPVFDVSVIKPFEPGSQQHPVGGNGRFGANGITLRNLIMMAWQLPPRNQNAIVNAPPWLDTDRWFIDAKVSGDQARADGNPVVVEPQQTPLMLRALLAERFHLQAHMDEREGDAYDLVVANPKLLTPADPNLPFYDPRRREDCVVAPGPDGIDPRIKHPALDRLLNCTNGTMEQLATGFQVVGAPVRDKTGLKGRYNWILSFSTTATLQESGLIPATAAGSPSDSAASDPNGAISLQEALKSELGLKLVKVKALVPVLVIDHIDEIPTPN